MRQPWLDETSPHAKDDDFSMRSATRPVSRVAVALVVAVLVLLAGTSSDLARSVDDLPILPGTGTVIEAARILDEAMRAIGLERPNAALRELRREVEETRF